MKDLQFVLIGVEGEAIKLLGDIPDNLTLVGKVQSYDIIKYYQKAKVYCQLSMREGLPNALCEAMLCECVPVGTNVQGITTAMGNNGILVDYGNVEQTCLAIRKALTMDGKGCRKYIIENFSESKRKELLIKLIEGES
jgi:glycosyltransferase involved in cell wall biosynthesis